MGIRSYLKGEDLKDVEERTLAPPSAPPSMLPYSWGPVLNVTEGATALRVSDAWACVRLLSDAVASLPAKVYRKTNAGRVEAGDDQRLVALLAEPWPGARATDLFSTAMAHLLLEGNFYCGKFRSGGTIVQLAPLDPRTVTVELKGQRVIYKITTPAGVSEHGVEDVLHIRGLTLDGLTGLSPIAQNRTALELSSNLQESARTFFRNGSRPSGIISAPSTGAEQLESLKEGWAQRHAGTENLHRVAIVSGEVKFEPLGFSSSDDEFLGQRELSTREIARVFRVPAHLIDGASGDSLTYSNSAQLNRYFLDYSLLPWLRRLELGFSGDPDLCPGGAFLRFNVDGFLRPDPAARSEIYSRALDANVGWMTRAEVRELEDLPPESAPAQASRVPEPREDVSPETESEEAQ